MRWLVVVLLLFVGGCAASESEPRYLYPPPAPCPAIDPQVVVPPSAPLAADFRPVSAVLCTYDTFGLPSRAATTGEPPAVRRSDGPFDQLVAALRTAPPTQRGELICPAMAQMPMFVALTDASGQVVIPAIPASPCGFRITSVDQAVEALSWA